MIRARYTKYERLIYKIAHAYNKQRPDISVEEFIAEGNLAFCEAQNNFNELKDSDFKSYLISCVNNKIKYFIKKGKSHIGNNSGKKAEYTFSMRGSGEEYQDILGNQFTYSRQGWEAEKFLSTFGSMSKLAIDIIRLILDAPQELIDMIPTEGNGLGKTILKTYLHDYQGYTFPEIAKCFSEIDKAIGDC